MSELSPVEATARQGFKYLNSYMVLMWRLGWGTGLNALPSLLGRYLILTHTGRKSGLIRRTPLNYANVQGQIYCVAGFGASSHWYQNIQANPQVEIWLPEGRFVGQAIDITDSPQNLYLIRQVLIGSGFASFALAGMNPYTVSNAELKEKTADYRLLHLRIEKPYQGESAEAPNDLTWVWQLGLMVLLGVWVIRRLIPSSDKHP